MVLKAKEYSLMVIISRQKRYPSPTVFLEDVLSQVNIRRDIALDTKVSISRAGKTYVISLLKTLKGTREKIRLFPNDRIYLSPYYERICINCRGDWRAKGIAG